MKREGGRRVLVLLGDVVASRRFRAEDDLVAGLRRALDGVNARVDALEPLALVQRDEFRAVYADLGTAAVAALRLRLATDDLVLATVDDVDEPVELRIGLGVGGDGTDGRATAADHAARARAEAEELAGRRSWPGSVRSRCHADDDLLRATTNAHLLLQDQLLARMDARDRRALRGLLDGERQVDVAAELGITQPAIARRLRDRGALAVHRALEELRAVPAAPLVGVPVDRGGTTTVAR